MWLVNVSPGRLLYAIVGWKHAKPCYEINPHSARWRTIQHRETDRYSVSEQTIGHHECVQTHSENSHTGNVSLSRSHIMDKVVHDEYKPL